MTELLNEIEEHIPALRRYARALTRNRDRADDLVQDCLERALRKRFLWRPTGPLRAWLFKILLNLYRNELKKGRALPAHESLGAIPIEPSQAANQGDRLALLEVSRALDQLAHDQREALLLVTLEGASYAEAADILGIPQGTLMSRLSRARATLKQLTDEGDAPRLRTVK